MSEIYNPKYTAKNIEQIAHHERSLHLSDRSLHQWNSIQDYADIYDIFNILNSNIRNLPNISNIPDIPE